MRVGLSLSGCLLTLEEQAVHCCDRVLFGLRKFLWTQQCISLGQLMAACMPELAQQQHASCKAFHGMACRNLANVAGFKSAAGRVHSCESHHSHLLLCLIIDLSICLRYDF